MQLKSFTLVLVLGFTSFAKAAVNLSEAYALWDFNYASSGSAGANQVVGRVGTQNLNAANTYNLTWTSAPSSATYGGVTVDRALHFSPVVVTTNPGPGTSGTSPENDFIKAAGFNVSNATLAGDLTLMTRMRWDGPPTGSDDKPSYYWFVNNGHGGANGYIFGVTDTGRLMYYHRNIPAGESGHPGAGVTYTFVTDITMAIGEWYDIAMVLDSLGDADAKTGRVSLYAASANAGFQKSISGNNLWISTQANTNLIVGSESLSLLGDANNSRKTLHGAMDYLAFFNQTFTETEIHNYFAVPEPSRALLMMAGATAMLFLRRRS